MNAPSKISKTLSANDLGLTGGHQAGILVPKAERILSFFPPLNENEKNPRVNMSFYDVDGVKNWPFVFIHYNNRKYGGTRNEYRLTWMTSYLKLKNAQVGDEVQFIRDIHGALSVTCQRAATPDMSEECEVLKLSGGWKVISIKSR
jgi:Restriction endonuclease EcoRII, N-terminal